MDSSTGNTAQFKNTESAFYTNVEYKGEHSRTHFQLNFRINFPIF